MGSEPWVLLGKFCFGVDPQGTPNVSQAGTVTIEVLTKQTGVGMFSLLFASIYFLKILTCSVFYDDQVGSWDAVYQPPGGSIPCIEQVALAKFPPGVLEIPPTNSTNPFSITLDVFEIQRPYYWYVVATSCAGAAFPLTLDYKVTFLNKVLCPSRSLCTSVCVCPGAAVWAPPVFMSFSCAAVCVRVLIR